MANKKRATAISDEEIIAALLANGTIAGAAAACGLAPRSIYDRIGTQDFSIKYSAAKADILRTALANTNSRLAAALDIVAEIMNNAENNPATRLQAAQTIINTTAKFADRLNEQDKKTFDATNATPFEFWQTFAGALK